MNGVINVYKEKGYTSHDIVAILRKVFNQKKIGHTGTLDPEAEGVLPVCLGKATKLASMITDGTKEYIAVVQFGRTTTTGDHTGETIESYEYVFNRQSVINVVDSFRGEYMQTPPMYSALKINGQKLYDIARQGKTIEREPRKIYIHDITILDIDSPDSIKIKVKCSKGTYIRTLCEDIGEKLGYGAHMNGLIRTSSGRFNLTGSHKLDEINRLKDEDNLQSIVLRMDNILGDYPVVYTKPEADRLILNGNRIRTDQINISVEVDSIVRLYTSDNVFVGLYSVIDKDDSIILKPYKILL